VIANVMLYKMKKSIAQEVVRDKNNKFTINLSQLFYA